MASSRMVYDDVAHAIEKLGAQTFTGEDIQAAIDAPFTQVAVAMGFLKERGCIVPARERRHKAAGDFVYEDALIEWHARTVGTRVSASVSPALVRLHPVPTLPSPSRSQGHAGGVAPPVTAQNPPDVNTWITFG